MAASASESQAQQSTTSISTQGAAGAGSPTIVSQGNVDYNDPALAEAALAVAQALGTAGISAGTTATGQAISVLNTTQGDVSAQEAQQSQDNNDLLQTVLQGQQELALSGQTGGASLTNSSTNYLIWGAIGVAALAVFAVLGKKH